MIELTDAKRRIVERLQRVDAATAGELAHTFELTDTAVRQHLDALEQAGLVRRTAARVNGTPGRGRPAAAWQLTPAAVEVFPDRHDGLTVDLLGSIRRVLGDTALDRVLRDRAIRQTDAYRATIDGQTLAMRVRRLAEQRSLEGYAAEVIGDGDDLILVEHHCPISAAANACDGVCQSELEVFRATLGDAEVHREQHLLAGDQRCSYRITASRQAENRAPRT